MNEIFRNFEFNDKVQGKLEIINGVKLPEDYLDFMSKHNGGEGTIGETAYACIFGIEELESMNEEYEVSKYHKDYFIFGTDGGGMLLGYNGNIKKYYAIDSCSIDENDKFYESDTLEEFFKKMSEE